MLIIENQKHFDEVVAFAKTVGLYEDDGKTSNALASKLKYLETYGGKDADGKQLADGNYTFSVEAQANGKKVDAKAMQIGTVNAVVRNGTGFMLDLGSMGEVSFSDVARII